ncbi:hypothetical protein V7S43_008245 [Phytophthora oleae]|uniref:Ubiquitin-like domain-containing protein n=1 Tax=Phytophthora oleae TaxID=2107226 RepID=A0ABD3FIN9_9STRA
MDSVAAPPSPTALHDEWALVNDEAEIVASVTTTEVRHHYIVCTSRYGYGFHSDAVYTSIQKVEGSEQEEKSVKHEVPEGYLPIRLRQGEEIRSAWFNATQKVDDFVSKFFAGELANGKKIRLIYMGMMLLPSRSLGEYGIEENGVIHSVITAAPPAPSPHAALQTNLKALNPQNSLLVLTGIFLYGLWTLFYYFPQFFSWKSTVLLALFSVMHISTLASRIIS